MALTVGLDGTIRQQSLKGGHLEEGIEGEKKVEEETSGEFGEEQVLD